jgi:hypothetical protein
MAAFGAMDRWQMHDQAGRRKYLDTYERAAFWLLPIASRLRRARSAMCWPMWAAAFRRCWHSRPIISMWSG